MKKMMPQEIEVWYLIPALRKEFAKIFIKDYKMSQKETAKIIGVTEAAVSQYLNSKRASKTRFSSKEMAKIRKSAEEASKNREKFMKILYSLCVSLRQTKTICTIHKSQDKSVPKNCDICFQN